MSVQQVLWPEAGVWVGLDETGMRYRMPGRSATVPGMPSLPLVGPVAAGGPVLWLDARGTLTGAGPWAHPLRQVAACAAEPLLLAAVLADATLLLNAPERATSVALPAVPRALAALGGAGGAVAHCLLGFADGVYALRWQDERVTTELLAPGLVDALLLLAGDPPAAVLRLPSQGVDRLAVFQFRAAPWARWWPLEPLVAEAGVPLAVRQERDGLLVQVQPGRWLRHQGGEWRDAPAAFEAGVPTFRHGHWATCGREPWSEKEQIPSHAKLALARHRQPDQEHTSQGKPYRAQGNFVSRPVDR